MSKPFEEIRVKVCGPSDETDVARALRDVAARFDQGVAHKAIGFALPTGPRTVEVYITRPGEPDDVA